MLTVGMLAMGSMGSAFAERLTENGVEVLCLTSDRSVETRARARQSRATECATLTELIRRSDLLFCVAPSDVSEAIALDVAKSVSASDMGDHRPIYVDANPHSSKRFVRIQTALRAAGFSVVDAAVFGLPPDRSGRRPLLVVSGDNVGPLRRLDGIAADLLPVSGEPGDASFLKVLQCCASKGSNALLASLAVAAAQHDVLEQFFLVLSKANPDLSDRLARSLPWMPADADRWQTEMNETLDQMQDLDLPSDFAMGTATMLKLMSASPLGHETRDARDAGRTWAETARVLADHAQSTQATSETFVLTMMTDDVAVARWGVNAGIERIGPDLEVFGKAERQVSISSRISRHDPEFFKVFRNEAGNSELFARTDPIHENSAALIEGLIEAGVTSIMLPYFFEAGDVEAFVRLVDGRARTTILVETAPALFRLPEILSVAGVDEVHFGLTDLMLSTGVGSRFEILCSDLLSRSSDVVHESGKPLHIAGIASIKDDMLPLSADLTLARYVQLGACGSLVTRAFTGNCRDQADFVTQIELFRRRVDHWRNASSGEVSEAVDALRRTVQNLRATGKKLP